MLEIIARRFEINTKPAVLCVFSRFFLNPLNMSSAQCLNFTTQFKILPDGIIRQNAKAINYGNWISCPRYNVFRIEFKILAMRYCQYQCFNTFQYSLQVVVDTQFFK